MEQDRMSRDKPTHLCSPNYDKGFPHGAVVKNTAVNAGDVRDMGLIPGSRIWPGLENDNPLQQSCLENYMDRGVWQATFHGVAKTWT